MIKITSTTQFIIESSVAHGYKYSYLKTNYIDLYTNVVITCPIHGDYEIYARNHARRNSGCQKCSLEAKGKAASTYFKLSFIQKAHNIHGNKYEYPQLPDTSRTRIKIKCFKHGYFIQYASSHLQGYGCSKCSREKTKLNPSIKRGGWNIKRWVELSKRSNYFDGFKLYKVRLYNETESFYKIGRTFTYLEKRLSTIPYQWEIVEVIKSSAENVFNKELALKKKLKPFKYIPALDFKGRNECYSKLE